MPQTTAKGFKKPVDTDFADLKVFVGENMDLLETELDKKSNKPTTGDVTGSLPTTTPSYAGQLHIDKTNQKAYIATSDTGWERVAETTYVDTADSYIMNTILGGLKLWKGTQAQYDAITTKDANTLYFISG